MGRTACTQPQCLYKGALYLSYSTRNMKYIFYLPSILLCVYKGIPVTIYVHLILTSRLRYAVAQSVLAELYKSEGCGFDSR